MTEPSIAGHEEYVRGELLGSGLTSDLYLGQYGEDGVPVLLKQFHIPNLDAARLSRLRWQMLWMGATRHPSVAWMRALLQDDEGRPMLVLQQVGEETLEQFLVRNDWGLATSAALSLMRQLTAALQHAAALNLDYTFIQPATIMLDGDANPILLGFDLAGEVNLPELAANAPAGQLALLAPEQRSGHGSSERSLIYSLGALLTRLIAPDWLVGQRQHRVSAATETLLRTALAHDPQARYPDLPAFMEALDAAAAAEDPLAGVQDAAASLAALGVGWTSPPPPATKPPPPAESRIFATPPTAPPPTAPPLAQPAMQAVIPSREPQPPAAAPVVGAAPARQRRSLASLPLLYLLLALLAGGTILAAVQTDLFGAGGRSSGVADSAPTPTPTLFGQGGATPLATNTAEPPRVQAIRSTATATATGVPATATQARPTETATRPSPTPSLKPATATPTPLPSATPSATRVFIPPPPPPAATATPPPSPTAPPPSPTVPPPPPPPPPPPTEPPPPPTAPPPTPTVPALPPPTPTAPLP